MFFIFSKILAFLITPLVWLLVLLGWAVFTKDPGRKKKLVRYTFILTLFFSNAFIFDEAVRAWELPATPYEEVKKYEYGIVLGGMSSYDPTLQRAQFYRGVDRLIQTVELYRRGNIKKIIFTGGSGSIEHPDMKEGNYVNRYMLYMGIPKEDFLVESESQNTRENATLTRKLIDEKKIDGKMLLITSAFHMRRSIGCFEKAGIDIDSYTTDRYAGPRKFEFDHLFIPNLSAMEDWNNLIHEVVGYITYKIFGYC
ncbi:MAG TPA: YdcF family protein [Bacteroidia bacterium]|jgi:uncharacterized SAM-binding protein YcdF (DUF218 family)